MEQKGFMEPDPNKRQPPNYESISSNQVPRPNDNPPPYYSQPVGYVQQLQPTIVIQPTATQIVCLPPLVGPEPWNIVCPNCRQNVMTRMEVDVSSRTHLGALVLCLVFWPVFWIPYVMDKCKDKNHYCSECDIYIGTYRY